MSEDEITDNLDWKKIAKFRDLVSHHYEHVDPVTRHSLPVARL
jgi:uncharacterized protein with HEPN domain